MALATFLANSCMTPFDLVWSDAERTPRPVIPFLWGEFWSRPTCWCVDLSVRASTLAKVYVRMPDYLRPTRVLTVVISVCLIRRSINHRCNRGAWRVRSSNGLSKVLSRTQQSPGIMTIRIEPLSSSRTVSICHVRCTGDCHRCDGGLGVAEGVMGRCCERRLRRSS
ncbi:hypothetical protein BC834DRAFT_258302 [Gloeopeniophorella convolvens]|nr:hypothetical protein BC834DRAFT_258302 [Gloeopeniophorella convolvens]